MTKHNALTALRFPAAVSLVVFHLRMVGVPRTFLSDWPLSCGVSFFFVLSGFILTQVYPEFHSAVSRREFWVARFARLWPTHVLMLVLTIVLTGAAISPVSALFANAMMIHSWLPISGYFLSYNGPSWSISVEVFFYLLFPFLVVNLKSRWPFILIGSCALAVGCVAITTALSIPAYKSIDWTVSMNGLVYYEPAVRLFEFCIGMSLSLAYSTISRSFKFQKGYGTILEIFAVALFLVNAKGVTSVAQMAGAAFGEPFALWAGTGLALLPGTSLLIFVFALDAGHISKAIGCRLGVFLGEVSFAIYMLHYVLISTYCAHAGVVSSFTERQRLLLFIAVLSFGSAAIFIVVETPLRRIIKSLARQWLHFDRLTAGSVGFLGLRV